MWAGSEADIAKRTIDIDTGILNLAMISHLVNTFPQVGCFYVSSLHITFYIYFYILTYFYLYHESIKQV